MGVLGMTLVACLVYSAATEQRKYAAYTPSAGLAERQVKQGDLTKMEMQLAAKEVSSSSSDSVWRPRRQRWHKHESLDGLPLFLEWSASRHELESLGAAARCKQGAIPERCMDTASSPNARSKQAPLLLRALRALP